MPQDEQAQDRVAEQGRNPREGLEEALLELEELAGDGAGDDSPTGQVAAGDHERPAGRHPARLGILDPIPGLMQARETHMLSGSSGAGKTSWVAWLVVQLLTQDSIFDFPIQRPPFVAYMAGDRALDDAREKFISAGWAEPITWGMIEDQSPGIGHALRATRMGLVDKVKDFPILTRGLEALRLEHFSTEKSLPPDSLIVIDGMATILGIEPSGSYLRHVAAPLTQLNRFCRAEKLTILLVHHGGKQIADPAKRYARAQDRILGSMGLLGHTSTQIQLTEPELTSDPSLGWHELTVSSHSAPGFVRQFQRLASGVFSPVVQDAPQAAQEATGEAIGAGEGSGAGRRRVGPPGRSPELLAWIGEEAGTPEEISEELGLTGPGWRMAVLFVTEAHGKVTKYALYRAIKTLLEVGEVETAKDHMGRLWIRKISRTKN